MIINLLLRFTRLHYPIVTNVNTRLFMQFLPAPRCTPLLLLLLTLLGCTAPPVEQTAAPPDLDLRTTEPGDLIRLRRLTQADFSAELPPLTPTPGVVRLGLHPSLGILVSPYATLGFRPITADDGSEQFEMLAKNVSYTAVLDRRHSWLSPELTPAQLGYVLPYAYVHFSLYESAARRLTQAASELLAEGYRGRQPLALVQQFTNAMAERIKQELAQVETRAREFDLATTQQVDTKALLAWSEQIEQELRATEQLSYSTFMETNFPGALTNRINQLTFTNAGLYDPGPCEGMVLKLQSLGHFGCVSSKIPEFINKTQQIPLRKNLTFGVQFTPAGLRATQWAELDVVTVYPEPGVRPPDESKSYSSNIAQILVSGDSANASNLYLYQLSNDWELVPGSWRFEFYSQGQKIGEQRFELLTPDPPSQP